MEWTFLKVYNGVKQGSILSPILFNFYLDVLLDKLKTCGVGCYIGWTFAGCLAYADDVTLLGPSVTGPQGMLQVAKTFSLEFQMLFNESKTECICFHQGITVDNSHVYLGSKRLSWKKVKYFGVYVNSKLDDIEDIDRKTGKLISSVNMF